MLHCLLDEKNSLNGFVEVRSGKAPYLAEFNFYK